MINIFSGDAFSVTTLTGVINKLVIAPGRLGQLGLFRPTPVKTLTITLDQIAGKIKLVPPSPRGAPGQTKEKRRGVQRALVIPHFQRDDGINADEVQDVRQLGSEDQTKDLQQYLGERMQEHSQDLDASDELARVGAIKGNVVYSDGSNLDLFSTFEVAQPDEIFFDLAKANPTMGALREQIQEEVIRKMGRQMPGVAISNIRCMCGDAFFSKLISHKEVRETYLNQVGAAELRGPYIGIGDQSWGSFDFGGVTWENYRGEVADEETGELTPFIGPDDAHFFPVGVPGLFRVFYAPADYNETVNKLGQKRYAKVYPKPDDKGYEMQVQTNALHICTQPQVLLKGSKNAS
ncbi:major capsid protein [Terrarubrum flagellatum]|uniref:major capsid protein n=1 Tax=Terrirubrum flagellatum TaxID=2895980 RepID=UPI00314564FD